MEYFIQNLEQIDDYNTKLKGICKQNGLKLAVLHSLTLNKVANIYNHISTEFYQHLAEQQEQKTFGWIEKEKSIFPFVLMGLSLIAKKTVIEFDKEQYYVLSNIFQKKSRGFLQYEAMILLDNKQIGKRKWAAHQEELLSSLASEKIGNNQSKVKWKEISKQIFQQSNYQYYRTGKACREKWFNHLDPQKKHGNWDIEEDRLIVEYVVNKGKKWSEIAKNLDNSRTQHMIKNRFKSLLIHQKKKVKDHRREEKILSDLARDLDIEEKIKNRSSSRRKEGKKQSSSHLQKQPNPISVKEDNINVKCQEKLGQGEDIKQQAPENAEINYSPYCFIPTPQTGYHYTPIMMNGSPSVPFYYNNTFSDRFANYQMFFGNQVQLQEQNKNPSYNNSPHPN